jgi:hypothetical protein
MQTYLGAIMIIFMIGMVSARVAMLRRRGIAAMQFGSLLPRWDD